ncbi:hypothetical protein OF83DRAFT_1180001 [Amylostereum chailletii]|nr:hypothetical protein OF83DRAFT_1180001 [Amylostereum chailletii]
MNPPSPEISPKSAAMPRKSRAGQARKENLERARQTLAQNSARSASHGTTLPSSDSDAAPEPGLHTELDPDLESFCRRFSRIPTIEECDDEPDGSDDDDDDDDVEPDDTFDGPEVTEQSALEHFSSVLQEA